MREITFKLTGFPQLTIWAREINGTLKLDFTIDPASKASLQGIYLDTLQERNIAVAGQHITGRTFGDTSMAGPSTNLNGHNGLKDGFDFGLGIGNPGRGTGIVQSTSITLSSLDGNPLTLDSLSHELLGIRLQNAGAPGPKHVMVMPAAPDAIDDVLPAQVREDVLFSIDATANDTDADGNKLKIVSVADPANGTAVINATTNRIDYTSDAHFSGFETFTYKTSDGTGGYDVATIKIAVDAVADAALVSAKVVDTLDVHEVVIDISSALVDVDGSEDYVLRISGLGEGATLDGATYVAADDAWYVYDPDGLDQVKVRLADGQSHDFDVKIEAISREADGAWNWDKTNDTAISSSSVHVEVDFQSDNRTVAFQAVDQSQWTTGAEFTFDDERFIGPDTKGGDTFTILGGIVSGGGNAEIKVGLQSDLHFGGGEVDATIPYDLSIDSTYNRTTDTLRLDTAAVLAAGGGFTTDGPELTYKLDFIVDLLITAYANYDIGVDKGSIFNTTLFDVNTSANIIDFDSDKNPTIGYDFPYGISADLTWPNLEVTGADQGGGLYQGDGASNNFLDLNIDIDELITKALKLSDNPFDYTFDDLAPLVEATISLLDADLLGGLNFIQDFELKAGDLKATLEIEDGSTRDFTFGDAFVFKDASEIDKKGNNDGDVDYTVNLDLLNSTFSNDTDVGVNIGWNFDLLSGSASYNYLLDKGTESFGPLVDLGDSYPVAAISVYDNNFVLNFNDQSYSLFA